MPYKKMMIGKANSVKACEFLVQNGHSMRDSQRIIDKKRLYQYDNLIEDKKQILDGLIYKIDYECISKGLMPFFEIDDFAVFDKPSGVLSHPNGRNCLYSMNDEIWSLYGKEAGVAHRLDKETSGILIVAKNSKSQSELKKSFENRVISKTYIALVYGKIEHDFIINEPIGSSYENDEIKVRMRIRRDGKEAITEIIPIKYFSDLDMTLVNAKPKTGRQHQIRLHLFCKNHKIVGDPLYGLDVQIFENIMDEKLSVKERIEKTGASRLLLHASEVKFSYKNQEYDIKSNLDVEKEFLGSIF